MYNFMYKCRYCGKVYNHGVTGSQEIAEGVLIEFACGKQVVSSIHDKPIGIPVSMIDIHTSCKSNCIGIADFVGINDKPYIGEQEHG